MRKLRNAEYRALHSWTGLSSILMPQYKLLNRGEVGNPLPRDPRQLCDFFPKSDIHSIEERYEQYMIFTSKHLCQKARLVGGLIAEEENVHHDVVRECCIN
jgi:hypothetical protein